MKQTDCESNTAWLSGLLKNELPLRAGEVALIGAGPGDPGLLTLRALSLLQQAEVVVYDRLVSSEIMAFCPADAELINAGKSASCHVLTQDNTNQLLVDQATSGKRVVRIKGGDPYIFGRGGEEVEFLIENEVGFRVVPGITSAQGCSTYAGFPLTHRDFAQSVTFVTGHLKKGGELALNWSALAAPDQTVVFYMGLSNAEKITEELMAHHRDPHTPVALIQRGTTSKQRVVITDLQDLPQAIIREQLKPPTMMVVGEVVVLADKIGGCQKTFNDVDNQACC